LAVTSFRHGLLPTRQAYAPLRRAGLSARRASFASSSAGEKRRVARRSELASSRRRSSIPEVERAKGRLMIGLVAGAPPCRDGIELEKRERKACEDKPRAARSRRRPVRG